MALTRDQILAVPRSTPVKENVPEWGGDVYLKPLTARDLQRIASTAKESPDQLPMLVESLCDEDGKPTMKAEDVEALRDKDAAPVVRLLAIVRRMNGLTDEAPKA